MRKARPLLWLSLFSAVFLVVQLAVSQPQTYPLKIYCIDVDQGSSTLIVTPNGKSILIDCGDDGAADSVYEAITSRARLSAIDYFVCTHYHDDHCGALDKLIEKGLSVSGTFYDKDSQNWLRTHRTETDDYEEYDNISSGKRE
jgi:glyoxylase-like metal-dependent hydrolase (beta-lactamase superfamily II)